MVISVRDKKGKWVFIVPVFGLVLTDTVKNEITINKVTFISLKKLARVRKRFGIRKRISELKKSDWKSYFFKQTETTVGIVRCSGIPSEISNNIIRLVEEELQILSTSQLGYVKRRYNFFPTNYKGASSISRFLCLNTENDSGLLSNQLKGKAGDLVLDKRWLNFQKKVFFFNLMKIIKGEIEVKKSWRKCLLRAVNLVGQSITSTDVAHSFLLNMIAIETLLTRQGDKYSEIIPKRIEAFIGWVGYWNKRNYKKRIADIYSKRCQYVHDGNKANIEIKDLLFADEILLNVLLNIVSHHKTFKSKAAIIEFTEKIEAMHILGVERKKSKIQPMSMRFLRNTYTKEDYEKI